MNSAILNKTNVSQIERLNLEDLPCPLPLIKLKKKLSEIHQSGKTGVGLRLSATDKGVLKDIPAFCQQKGLMCEIELTSSPFQIRIEVS